MINQEVENTGCGIATFGNATDFESFSSTKEWMKIKGLCKDNGFVTIPQMRSALEEKTGKNISQHNSVNKLGLKAVLFVEFSKKGRERHWVYFADGLYYDPMPGNLNPTTQITYKVTRILNING